ncbi:hypothetical protein CVV38_01320 [Candidatus Peregrinibacteria bacterium HGW-Peregrinibacteria-1]|jgi:uncharacterized protein YlxW (UPF0749 family)|nr:MAG: hypothetical protein CVV38_01320 [Candidatus Peregrinibacteria bacterium HGW-Peregrinibacteria-1]
MQKFKLVNLGVGVLCGLLISFNWGVELPHNSLGNEAEAMETLLSDYISEQVYLQTRIEILRDEIEDAENEIEIQGDEVSLSTLEELRKDIGLGKVSGAGIEVVVDNGRNVGRSGEGMAVNLVQASDLRDVVNALYSGGAEAISINGRRLITSSTINSVGSNILVNGVGISAPYNVEAIGNIDTMLSRIEDRTLLASFYTKVLNANIRLMVEIHDRISINEYNGELKSDLINIIN